MCSFLLFHRQFVYEMPFLHHLQSSATYWGSPLPAMSIDKYKRHSRAICYSSARIKKFQKTDPPNVAILWTHATLCQISKIGKYFLSSFLYFILFWLFLHCKMVILGPPWRNWLNWFLSDFSVLTVNNTWFGNQVCSSRWFWQLFDFLSRTTGPGSEETKRAPRKDGVPETPPPAYLAHRSTQPHTPHTHLLLKL